MKTKTTLGQKIGFSLLSLLLIAFFCVLILSSAFVIYAEKGIDATLDMDMLIGRQGRTTKLYYRDADGNAVELENERLYGAENRIWVALEDIPIDVQNAFVAIEDHRFFEHSGVDLKRTAGAILSFVTPGKSAYGGSTITQQLVKNLTGDNTVTPKRKITEMMRAGELEKNISKSAILELYLNTVYLSEGCYGLETASELYFGKNASELSLAEGATLAAIIQYPSRYDPIQHPEYNKERRDTILWRMRELELITEEAYREALDTPIVLHIDAAQTEDSRHSWFTETVIEDVIRDLSEKYSLSHTAAAHMLYNGGLSIYTTMDIDMQKTMEAYYEDTENFPASEEGERANAAAVVINPKNGYLLAVAGDTGKKKSDRIFNLATRMLRSPGSVMKPVSVYAPALEKDLITWASVYDDVPVNITKEGNSYSLWPKNNPRVYAGLTTVHTALCKSTNTVAVRILQELGVQTSFRYAKSLGISTLIEHEQAENGKILTDIALAPMALGAVTKGVSVREMTGAYGAFAAEGVFYKPISYTEVYDKDGQLLLSNPTSGEKIFSEDTADLMTRLLQNVVKYGTASDLTLQKSVPVAGKTGTSNANTDRWFIGYTPDLLCGVWYGHKDARDIGTHKKNPAVLIFDGLMTKIYAQNAAQTVTLDKNHTFAQSENVISCLYCKDSGARPASACSHDPRGHRIALGYFKKGTEPKSACETHILVDYDAKTRAVASERCPNENIIRVALIQNYNRSFPCQINITDAQYIYRHLSYGASPSPNENEAFFQNFYQSDGRFIGISGNKHAYNCHCAEHDHVPEETTASPEETTAILEETTTLPQETTTPPQTVESSPRTEETTSSKRLVPWRFGA